MEAAPKRWRKLPRRLRWSSVFVAGAAAQWVIQKGLDWLEPHLPAALAKAVSGMQWLLELVPPHWLLLIALGAALPFLAEKIPVFISYVTALWKRLIAPWRTDNSVIVVNKDVVGSQSAPTQGISLPATDERTPTLAELARRLTYPAIPLDMGAWVPPPKPRQPTAYEIERKLRHLDKIKAVLEEMAPLSNRGMGLQSSAWNAFKHPNDFATYRSDLLEFRNAFKDKAELLNSIRDQAPEYDDVVAATQLPNYPASLAAIEGFLHTYDHIAAHLNQSATLDVFDRFMKNDTQEFGKAVMEFTYWRNDAHAHIVDVIRRMSK